MTTVPKTRVFLSYAHRDGSELANRLFHDLTREGYDVWMDKTRLKGGSVWTADVEHALEASDVVLALISRGAHVSDICRAEQLRSLRTGKCVIPVLVQPNVDRPLHLEAKQYRDLSNELTYDDEFRLLSEDIGHRAGSVLVSAYRHTYVTVPPLPPNYVERRNDLEALRRAVLDDGASRRVALTALKGMAGVGKTILAQALCLDETVQSAFLDGIVWLNIGKDPRDLLPLFREAGRATGDSLEAYDSVQSASNHLRNYLRHKAVLLVLDDVWDPHDAAPFMIDSPLSRTLITTRDARTAVSLGAQQRTLDVLTREQSLELIARWSDCPVSVLPPEANEIVRECGRLPLALAMVGALLRAKPERWQSMLHKLRHADLEKIRQSFPDYPHPDLLRAIDISLSALDERTRDRYLGFAVFPEDAGIPEAAIKTLWSLDQYEVEDMVDQLVDLSLATRDADGKLRIHDLLLDYLRHRLGAEKLCEAHNRLLQAYSGLCAGCWKDGPRDGYFFENLIWHMRKAERTDEAVRLICDFGWIDAKLHACGVISALTDYEWCPSVDQGPRLIQEALRLSAHVLADDPDQLPAQLLARLHPGQSSVTDALRNKIGAWHGAVWFRPLRDLLIAPGGSLMFSLVGHTARVRAVALTANGLRVVSGSDDNTLRIWDLKRGVLERTLNGHTDWIRAVAVLSDGETLVSASDDRTLRVWRIETGKEEYVASVHAWIRALVGLPGGKRVASVSDDRAVIWNLDSGTPESVLRNHRSEVNCIAVSPDGRLLVSGGNDRVLRVWSLDQGRSTRILRGHRAKVTSLSVTSDGKSVLSASADGSVLLWDLGHTEESPIAVIAQRVNGIRALTTLPDGTRAIAASDDHNLHVWNLTDGKERVLEGHSDCVNAVAVTPDGHFAVSASDDSSLKVWDLTRTAEPATPREHGDRVRAVGITPNGEIALSSSEDHTMRLWDMKSGTVLKTFENHHWVFAVSPDGTKVVSGGAWGGCRVWELQTAKQLLSFERHTDRIVSIAITPDGKQVLSSSDDSTLRLWSIDTGEEYFSIPVARYWPRTLAITPDSHYVIAGGAGTQLRLWDLCNAVEIRSYLGHTARVNSVGISSDGQSVVSGSDDHTVRIWELASAKALRVITGHLARVNAVTFSPSGKFVLSVSDDCDLRLWSVESGKCVASFTGEYPLLTCAISGRDPAVVAGDRSGCVHFFSLEGLSSPGWIGENVART
jgi:WD40 repeat protein